MQAQKPKETQLDSKRSKGDEQFARSRPRDSPTSRPVSTPTNQKSPTSQSQDDRRDEIDFRSGQRYRPDYQTDRKQYPEPDKRTHLRRDSRDNGSRRAEPINEQPRGDYSRQPDEREPNPSTLNDLLSHDNDLREWLEITGYHNAPYRNKILTRRRAIAALDAQREKLLAEMEAEERGGLPIAISSHIPTSSMLPPPIPNKVEARAESALPQAATSTTDSQRDRVVANKRPYSDVQDSRDEPNGAKVARIEDRPYSQRIKGEEELRRPRIKEEEEEGYRRPRSRGFEPSRRSSIDAQDDRYAVRARSREREPSPSRRDYGCRPASRSRPYDEDFHDRDERPFEIRGKYKGRAFDPNFRGRGRGRAQNAYDRYPQDSDTKNETSFGARIANGRPYRDPKGFDTGGKGGP